MLQNTWNIVQENFMVFYNAFVAFVGLNNNSIVAMQNIEFGLVSSDQYPDPAENASIEAIAILNIGSRTPIIYRLINDRMFPFTEESNK